MLTAVTSAKAQTSCYNPVSGEVFTDINLNGFRDMGEPGVAKAKVTLTGINSNYHQQTWSWEAPDAGLFLFEEYIPCGFYELTAKKGSRYFTQMIEIGEIGDTFYSLPLSPVK